MRRNVKAFDYTERSARARAEEAGLIDYGIVQHMERDGVMIYWARQAFNLELHRELLERGYVFQPFPAEFDDGDPESGPGTDGCDAWDQYQGSDEYIIIDPSGHVVHRSDRDLEMEAWIDANAGGPEGY